MLRWVGSFFAGCRSAGGFGQHTPSTNRVAKIHEVVYVFDECTNDDYLHSLSIASYRCERQSWVHMYVCMATICGGLLDLQMYKYNTWYACTYVCIYYNCVCHMHTVCMYIFREKQQNI